MGGAQMTGLAVLIFILKYVFLFYFILTGNYVGFVAVFLVYGLMFYLGRKRK